MLQVTTRLDSGHTSVPQAALAPALGESWAHSCTNRIMLDFDGAGRVARLLKSPSMCMQNVPYEVTTVGIRGASYMKQQQQLHQQQQQQQQQQTQQQPPFQQFQQQPQQPPQVQQSQQSSMQPQPSSQQRPQSAATATAFPPAAHMQSPSQATVPMAVSARASQSSGMKRPFGQ